MLSKIKELLGSEADSLLSYKAKFPKEKRYGLTLQIKRFVVSIPSNIAEGY